MISDIHSHTYYSRCGKDDPHLTIEAAIKGGIEVFGICDHNYGIGDRKKEYFKLLTSLREEYKGRIKLLRGIELATIRNLWLGDDEDISMFDYCLVEHIDTEETTVGLDIFNYAKRLACPTGIAHTDLIGWAKKLGRDPTEFLHGFAENGIFWEMNVNYDSIHRWHEHEYVTRFYESEEDVKAVRDSGIKIAVGFDGHRVEDYNPERVKKMCEYLEKNNIPQVNLYKE